MLVAGRTLQRAFNLRRPIESVKEMRFRSVLNTHQPQSDTLYTMRNENARDWECTGQGALDLPAEKEEALVRCQPIYSTGQLFTELHYRHRSRWASSALTAGKRRGLRRGDLELPEKSQSKAGSPRKSPFWIDRAYWPHESRPCHLHPRSRCRVPGEWLHA
jgi:hypothetical protein